MFVCSINRVFKLPHFQIFKLLSLTLPNFSYLYGENCQSEAVMKILYTICLISLFFPGGNILNAQEENNVKKAGIYLLNITLEDEFIEEYVASNRNRGSTKGYSISTILPDSLIKKIKTLAIELFQDKLKADVECIYKQNKKGEQVSTVGWGHVEGMPTNTYKGALTSSDMDYYVKIDVLMQTGGEPVFLGRGLYSKIDPRVIGNIKVFDRVKNEVFTNKVSLKNFSKLRSDLISQGEFNKVYSEVLGPMDLYMIYEVTMNRLVVSD